jgi:hypothetical protein
MSSREPTCLSALMPPSCDMTNATADSMPHFLRDEQQRAAVMQIGSLEQNKVFRRIRK